MITVRVPFSSARSVQPNDYYQKLGGTTNLNLYLDPQAVIPVGTRGPYGDWFSSGITGDYIPSTLTGAQNNEIQVDTEWATKDLVSPLPLNSGYYYTEMDGLDVQHDTMPEYLYNQILSDLGT